MTSRASVKVKENSKILKQLARELRALDAGAVDVGLLGGKRHEKVPEMTVAEIATVHEFGSDNGHIPERPFIRQTLREHNNYVELLARESRKFMNDQQSNATMLFKIGETVRGDIVQQITTGTFTPLAESTIKAKGSTSPLIDSGFMRNSIEWRVSK